MTKLYKIEAEGNNVTLTILEENKGEEQETGSIKMTKRVAEALGRRLLEIVREMQ